MGRARASSLLLAAAIGALACAGIPSGGSGGGRGGAVPQPGAVTLDGLQLVLWDGPGVIFARAPRPDLGLYRGIVFGEPSLEYRSGTPQRRALDEPRLLEHLRSAVAGELSGAGGWSLAEAPAEGVLQIGLAVLDLALQDRALTNRASTAYVAPSGGVSIVLDLRDSLTGETLLRYAQRRVLPGGVYYDPTTVELERAERAFDSFAEDVRAGLDWFRGEFERQRAKEEGSG
jgi:hypothetical protein